MGRPRVSSTFTTLTSYMGILKVSVPYVLRRAVLFDTEQANILMSNDMPPRACLADFGFMIMVMDPTKPLSCSAQLEGGTMTFMAPELLVPSKFGLEDSFPTPQADIYAFGLVIYQVSELDRECKPLLKLLPRS